VAGGALQGEAAAAALAWIAEAMGAAWGVVAAATWEAVAVTAGGVTAVPWGVGAADMGAAWEVDVAATWEVVAVMGVWGEEGMVGMIWGVATEVAAVTEVVTVSWYGGRKEAAFVDSWCVSYIGLRV